MARWQWTTFNVPLNSNTGWRRSGASQQNKVERQTGVFVLLLWVFAAVIPVISGVLMASPGVPKSALKEGEWPFLDTFVLQCHSRINVCYLHVLCSRWQLKSWPWPWVKPSTAGTSRKRRSWAAGWPSSLSPWPSLSTARPIRKLP